MPELGETHVTNRTMVHPHHANMLETAHGGNVLKWMDEVGAMSAIRFAGEICVTARMNQVNFRRPIPVGDVALVEAYVYDAGETSVRVRVEVDREDLRTGERELTTESYVVYVAIDEDGRPTPVPDLAIEGEESRRLAEAARQGEHEPRSK